MKRNSLLPHVAKPGRYLGGEYNTIRQDWHAAEVRFALIFPDLYEIGMSHLGLQILYHILNRRDGFLAERCFAPDRDAEQFLKERQEPLRSLESSRKLTEFDVLGITLPYELCYTNILTILHLAAIPSRSAERSETDPLVIGGGSCALNPEPVADFFDAILLGDGEEAVVEIADTLRAAKAEGLGRAEKLARLAAVDGLYLPGLYRTQGDVPGGIIAIEARGGAPAEVRRRVVADLSATSHLHHPIVPNAKIVHDRLGVEIARGCTRGCRFCQAGMIYRPVRERSTEEILELAETGIANTGFEELALLSLSTGDHSCINHILPRLMDSLSAKYVSVSMPSMRVGTLSQEVMDQIKRVRKTGFTVAPEAGSERLRRVINKGITEEDLLRTCTDAFAMGWNAIKLYFMIGLPTETEEDIEAIAALSAKVAAIARKNGGRRKQVTVSVGTFVPKPHTPFQWQAQLSLAESRRRIGLLKAGMPKAGVKLKWHDPEMSFLEGVFSRGDRRLGHLIEAAWSLGARFDGWSDHFDISLWQEAAATCSIDLDVYLRERDRSEILPWQHLGSGVETAFLQEEMDNALGEAYTPDCRYHGCQGCGLCDFAAIRPVVHGAEAVAPSPPEGLPKPAAAAERAEHHFRYLVHYARRGDISFLGHLELLQLIFRALRRAGIQTHFSKGFNPSPKVSFGGALPVGLESEAEFFLMDLPAPLDSAEKTAARLNGCLPEGLLVKTIELHSGRLPQQLVNFYTVELPWVLGERDREAIAAYRDCRHFPVKRRRKGKETELDIRPLLQELQQRNDTTLELAMSVRAGSPGVKIPDALATILSRPLADFATSRIRKTSWRQLPEEAARER